MKRYKCSNFNILEVTTKQAIPSKVLKDLLQDIDMQTKYGLVSEIPGIMLEKLPGEKHETSGKHPESAPTAEFNIFSKTNPGEKVLMKLVGKPDKHIHLFPDGTLFLEAGYKYQIIYRICPEEAIFSVKLEGMKNPCEITSGLAGFCVETRRPVKFALIFKGKCPLELKGSLVIEKSRLC